MGGEVRKVLCAKSSGIVDLFQFSLNPFLTESSMFSNELDMICYKGLIKTCMEDCVTSVASSTF